MNSEMIGYKWLRRLIGIVGIVFPLALLATVLIMGGPVPGSISDYYYSNEVCQSILVGSLCAIACFLFTYRGYDKDYIPVRLAAIFAAGVAFFPTVPVDPTGFNKLIGIFHGSFAALMFMSLAYISFFLFTKAKKITSVEYPEFSNFTKEQWKSVYRLSMGIKKRKRNIIFRVCGGVMALSMVMIFVLNFLLHIPYSMYILETIIVEAFAVSWLVKGETILADKKL